MSKKSLAVAVALAASVLAQAQLVLNTPSESHQCQPTTITWEGGEGVSALHLGFKPTAARRSDLTFHFNPPRRFQRDNKVIESFGTLGSNVFIWNTNVAAGSVIKLVLIDAIEEFVESAPFTVLPGSNDCTLI
ncbi:hypothetical protein BC628DRAFT_1424210 [Trametes gibbosa]|nr:hypothetical protein BC628DRAFT_1424210 [Trametes gibbosa]